MVNNSYRKPRYPSRRCDLPSPTCHQCVSPRYVSYFNESTSYLPARQCEVHSCCAQPRTPQPPPPSSQCVYYHNNHHGRNCQYRSPRPPPPPRCDYHNSRPERTGLMSRSMSLLSRSMSNLNVFSRL
jgi:hypothetical protein